MRTPGAAAGGAGPAAPGGLAEPATCGTASGHDAVAQLAEALRPLVARPWLLVGIGSDLRGDDAFGPLLARRLAAAGLPAIDAGTSPESVTGPIRRSGAEVLLLADLGRLGAPPGTLRLLEIGRVSPGGTSTHDPSLRLLVEYLSAERPWTVRVLAVEPAHSGLGTPPSESVVAAVETAAAAFAAATGAAATHAT